jgi:hypothetical protein
MMASIVSGMPSEVAPQTALLEVTPLKSGSQKDQYRETRLRPPTTSAHPRAPWNRAGLKQQGRPYLNAYGAAPESAPLLLAVSLFARGPRG